MKKFGNFLKNLFTKDLDVKALAIVLAVLSVAFINM
jgi:hypothetical protein